MLYGVFDEVCVVDGVAHADNYADHLQMTVLAEQLGYHSYWFAEHHFGSHRAAPSPNLLLAAAAVKTNRILLGNMINVLPFHHPVRVAEEAAMLDHLTRGRLQFGIGRGVQKPEFDRLCVDMSASREMFQEAVGMLDRLWTDGPVDGHGDFWRFNDVSLVPRPLQRPHPPYWVAGMSRESMQWAAQRGLPYVTSFLTRDEVAALAAEYQEITSASGADGSGACFAVMRHLHVADTLDDGRAEVGETYDRLFHSWLDVALTTTDGVPASYKDYPDRRARLAAMKLDDLMDEGIVLFGGRSEIRDGIAELERSGVDMLLVWVTAPGVPSALGERSLRLLATDVAPELASAPAPQH